jgi:hypothetical protein
MASALAYALGAAVAEVAALAAVARKLHRAASRGGAHLYA